MQACKWVIGNSSYLDYAHDIWQRNYPDIKIEKIRIQQNEKHNFNYSPLDDLDPSEGLVFLAYDESFGNFKRAELMQEAMTRGFKLCSFISPLASIASNAKIGLNSFIGDGVVIGYGSRIDFNSVLVSGVFIGNETHIRSSCWIESNVVIGNEVEVGMHCTIRSGSILAKRIIVGKHCELDWAQKYKEDIPPKTYFDSRYSEPIYTHGQ